MRSDMDKLICECYRITYYSTPARYSNRRRKLKDELRDNPEEATSRESIKYPYSHSPMGQKEFGENLNPLRRYILSQIGRPWNDVHSEMSEHIRMDSTVQRHIWEHVYDYVELLTSLGDDGKVYYRMDGSLYGGTLEFPIENAWSEVYVCPVEGILKKVPKLGHNEKRRKNDPKPYHFVVIDKDRQAHNIWGDWYIVTLAQVPQKIWKPWTDKQVEDFENRLVEAGPDYYTQEYRADKKGRWTQEYHKDVATGDILAYGRTKFYKDWDRVNITGAEKKIYGISGVYAKKRKQMSTRELKRYGLKK